MQPAQREDPLQDGIRQRLCSAIHRLGGGHQFVPDLRELTRPRPLDDRVGHRIDANRRAFPGVPGRERDADRASYVPTPEISPPSVGPKRPGGRVWPTPFSHRREVGPCPYPLASRQKTGGVPRNAILGHEGAICHEPASAQLPTPPKAYRRRRHHSTPDGPDVHYRAAAE